MGAALVYVEVNSKELELRDLYIKKADVIIFDEVTSALDSETQIAVMTAIETMNKNLTLLSHRSRINYIEKLFASYSTVHSGRQ